MLVKLFKLILLFPEHRHVQNVSSSMVFSKLLSNGGSFPAVLLLMHQDEQIRETCEESVLCFLPLQLLEP